MALKGGDRWGRFEILGSLGSGGMGEVYRARDVRLGRDVALKVVPPLFVNDGDRRARFEREAQVLASLNHANIAQIYGLEDAGPEAALVLELVEGETLAERVALGPLPVNEALAIARQIAEGLESAHEQGIVHRDLKPSNIKLRPDGMVKVLDFGLAKLVTSDPIASAAGLSLSPTITSPAMTQAGVILGTAAYMSPEQARGRAIDKRSDIWAFGVVVYEMLTGGRLFDAETMSDTIAAVLTREPDLATLPAAVPARVRTLLGRCLERDPLKRLRDIGEARLALAEGATDSVAVPAAVNARPRARRVVVGILAGVIAAAAGAIAAGYVLGRGSSPPAARLVYEIPLPANAELRLASKPAIAIAPNASAIAFVATSEGTSRLYVRARDEVTPRALPGTEDAAEPAFSPDGQWIAFTAGLDLKKVSLEGGAAVTLARGLVLEDSRGIAWSDRNQIVFAPDPRGALVIVPADGGAVTPLTTLDDGKGERTHRWPVALPGGRIVLFTVGSRASPDDYENAVIEAVDLDTSKRWTVTSNASLVKYVEPGYLLLSRGGTLSVVEFDVESGTLKGTPRVLVQGVAGDVTTGAVHVAVAQDGTLAYVAGTSGSNLRKLVWVDRTGATSPIDLPPAVYGDPRISPDGTRAALLIGPNGGADVHVYDFARGTLTPFSFDGRNASPAWSPNGRELLYVAIDNNGGKSHVFRRPADGGRNADEVTSMDSIFYLTQVLGSSEFVVGDALRRSAKGLNQSTSLRGFDAIRQETRPDAKPVLLADGPTDDYNMSQSPDGRYLIYTSQRTGRPEVYVRDATQGGGIWQVSTTGGEEPRWAPDGREIFFRYGTRLFVAPIELRPTFRAERPRVILEGVYDLRSETLGSYDIDPRTGRLLMVRLDQAPNAARAIRVVTNWMNGSSLSDR